MSLTTPLRVGCCLERPPHQCDLPFDYLELAVDAITSSVSAESASRPLPLAEIVMGMFPRGSRLVGYDIDFDGLTRRAAQVLAAASRAGATDLSFGAGAARSIPVGMARQQGLSQLGRLFREIAFAASAVGVRVHIETISAPHSNVFNRVGEIADFVADQRLDGIGILYDLRQAAIQAGARADARAHADRITHVHVPSEGLDDEIDALMAMLRATGYGGRISIEPPELVVTGAAIERARKIRG